MDRVITIRNCDLTNRILFAKWLSNNLPPPTLALTISLSTDHISTFDEYSSIISLYKKDDFILSKLNHNPINFTLIQDFYSILASEWEKNPDKLEKLGDAMSKRWSRLILKEHRSKKSIPIFLEKWTLNNSYRNHILELLEVSSGDKQHNVITGWRENYNQFTPIDKLGNDKIFQKLIDSLEPNIVNAYALYREMLLSV